MRISLNENELREWKSISSSLDETIEEAAYWNAVLFGEIPSKEWLTHADPLPLKAYRKDEYALKVRPAPYKEGDISLEYDQYAAKEGFVYDEISFDKQTYREQTPFGYFLEPFPFLSLKEKGRPWMSVIPHEINTMREHIELASGRVLTLGLGLGYFAYHASMKKSVNEVTIVEKDERVIDVFQKKILPFFEEKGKIKIVKGDAFEYLKQKESHTYCFADLWHLPEDGLPLYIALLKMEDRHPNMVFSYWIERSMLALLRRSLIVLFDENIRGNKDDSDYLFSSSFDDTLINACYFALKGEQIENISDLRRFLEINGLKRLAKKLSLSQ